MHQFEQGIINWIHFNLSIRLSIPLNASRLWKIMKKPLKSEDAHFRFRPLQEPAYLLVPRNNKSNRRYYTADWSCSWPASVLLTGLYSLFPQAPTRAAIIEKISIATGTIAWTARVEFLILSLIARKAGRWVSGYLVAVCKKCLDPGKFVVWTVVLGKYVVWKVGLGKYLLVDVVVFGVVNRRIFSFLLTLYRPSSWGKKTILGT